MKNIIITAASCVLTCPTERVSLGLLQRVGPSSFQMCLMTARELSLHSIVAFSSEMRASALRPSLAADLDGMKWRRGLTSRMDVSKSCW